MKLRVLIKTRCTVCESCGFTVVLRSLYVFRVSPRVVGVPSLSSRLLKLPGVFSSNLSGACLDWGGLAGTRHARRCQPTGNHLHRLGWLHWSCPLGLWRAFSLLRHCFCFYKLFSIIFFYQFFYRKYHINSGSLLFLVVISKIKYWINHEIILQLH
jgi:hypothetical protein